MERLRRNGTEVAFLMDDDLLDPAAQLDLPRAYRQRLWQRVTRLHRRLPGLVDRLWVTSAALAEKYGPQGAELLPLRPHVDLLAERPRLQLAYLGTSVHEAEFLWLLPLLEELQSRHSHTHVELFGNHDLNRRFRHLPRLRILHPMRWPNYLAETGSGRVDILLTPLLESRFNACRAPVKLIDAARCGAAGLYSNRPPYQGFVRDGLDGLLLDDDPANWLQVIERLIADPGERQRLAEGGRQRALALVQGPGD
jgi:glycosyltransferase involved in cell wall biosynthesis